jgi:hypothetical protein
MFYIYAYIDPNTNLPFYIGKGKGNRKNHHLNKTSSKKENKDKWETICSLTETGTPPIIKVLEDGIVNETMAYNREDYYILSYGRKGFEEGGILTNKTIGGKHPPVPKWTPKDRKRHSEFNKQYWTEERKKEHREKFLKPITNHGREQISLHSIGSVSVTDKFGNSKRILKSEYDKIDKTGPINTWEYVSVSSKESRRRKESP